MSFRDDKRKDSSSNRTGKSLRSVRRSDVGDILENFHKKPKNQNKILPIIKEDIVDSDRDELTPSPKNMSTKDLRGKMIRYSKDADLILMNIPDPSLIDESNYLGYWF